VHGPASLVSEHQIPAVVSLSGCQPVAHLLGGQAVSADTTAADILWCAGLLCLQAGQRT
jgi:hypothetical protein